MTGYPISPGRYDGRRVLVTGGANGLGFATAQRLAAEGATVGIVDLKQDALDAAVATLADAGHQAFGYAADVVEHGRVAEIVAAFHADHGSLDVLVAMAGIYPAVPFADMTPEVWKQVIDVNLTGTFNCAHAVMPFMKEQNYGRIVTVSSGTVMLGPPEFSAYVASKMGVIGLTRTLAREGGPFGITANIVLPGLMATEHAKEVQPPAAFEMLKTIQAVPRTGEPEDIADAIAYLGSEGASFITGQPLYASGGEAFI